MLISALGCVVVYLTKPQGMVWIALFLAFASLPADSTGQGLWPVGMYTTSRDPSCHRFPGSDCAPSVFGLRAAGDFLLTVAYFTAAGVAGGNDPEARVDREAMFLFDLVAGFVLAVLIVRANS